MIQSVPLKPGVEPCLAILEIRVHLFEIHLYNVQTDGEFVRIVISDITYPKRYQVNCHDLKNHDLLNPLSSRRGPRV